MTLTARTVETAKPRDKGYKLGDRDGLYLFVTPAGGKSWRANHYVPDAGTGKLKQKTRYYGMWPALGLSDARAKHDEAREAPAALSSATHKPEFRKVAEMWMKKHLPSLTNPKHRAQVEKTLEVFVYPKLGARPIDKITRTELVDIVQAVQQKPKSPLGDDRVETAHRVAGRITSVFNHAQDIGIIEAHPASGLTRVLQSRKTKKPMATIGKEEAKDLLKAIDGYPEPVTRLGLLLVAHTFVRVNEALGFRSGELRENGAMWVVPEERVKLGLAHAVPLSTQSQRIVEQLVALSTTDLVLESPARPGHPLSENTLLFALYRLGYRGRMTVHGFRALASTVLNEESPFGRDVIERQLAHQETDQVRAAYNRAEYLEQRRSLMQWWSDWLDAQRAAP